MNSLPESYFDGSRQALLNRLNEEFDDLFKPAKVERIKISNDSVDLPSHVADSIRDKYGSAYLSPFVRGITERKINKGETLLYTDFMEPMKYEGKMVVEINKSSLLTVLATEIYGIEVDMEASVRIDLPMPPAYGRTEDGQLKICVDTVLAVDAAITMCGRNLNILVIGSSSAGGVRSGDSYSMIPLMCAGSVEMYDPYEVPRSFDVEGPYGLVSYVGIKDKFYYSKSVLSRFDLVLDDSWELGRAYADRDVEDLVTQSKNFSIKCFPWEVEAYGGSRLGNIYYQKFFTDGREMRRVSRDPRLLGSLQHFDLGRCNACLELNYRLQNSYPREFYRKFISLHRKDCVNGSFVPKEVYSKRRTWISVDPMSVDLSGYCCITSDIVEGAQLINSRLFGIENVKFVFSQEANCPDRIYEQAYQVLILEEGACRCNIIRDLEPFVALPDIKKSTFANLTHSKDGKKKRKKFRRVNLRV